MSSKENFETIEQMTRMKITCARIFKNQKDFEAVTELQSLILDARPTIVKTLEPIIFSVFFPILKSISEEKSNFKEKEKQQLVDTFKACFEKISIDKLPLFFNIYGFLLFEIYDHKNHSILKISEEYKLSIVECMTELAKCLSSSVIEQLYVKENAPKLCQMIYVVLELAKNEEFRTLRIAAINCIMALAHVLNDHDFDDLVMRNQIAEVFLFFLPGVASQLKSVALIDEKFGHKVPTVALKAWGRIVTLLMQDYNASDQKISFLQKITNFKGKKSNKTRWKDENELKEYIKNTQRSPEWYEETDKKLQQIIVELSKLTHHSHPNVRVELVGVAALLLENCVHTMPTSISHLIDIVIILSEDDDISVSKKSKHILEILSDQLTMNEFRTLLDNLEESFYNIVTSIPRKFNGIDERIQTVSLNSLTGYIALFGRHSLTKVLHSSVHLNRLLLTLIHISEFDKSDVSILEEYTTPEYDFHQNLKTSWKRFHYFKEVSVLEKIETVCHLLSKFGAAPIVSDFLLDIILTDSDQRKQAIFLLNEILAGLEPDDRNSNIFKNAISTYTDSTNWHLPLSVMIDEYGYEVVLSDVQNNIIQVCLLVEGIGKIALALDKHFQQFMLKTLYLVLERAGSAHPVIRVAGVSALANISKACGYLTITDLINDNIDYFSFHIGRRLNRAQGDIGGLDVLAVVIKYSTKEVLNSTCEVIKELLLRTYDKHRNNLNSYLYVFKMFILGLHKWLSLEPLDAPFKTKKQKKEEFEDFQVSNIEPIDDFSDNIMGKSAEEMYKEDMEKRKSQIEEEINEPVLEEYKKPEPPTHIQLAVSILRRSLHYLPSKEQARKLLVLEILKNGVLVLNDWENELLPIVHQIWSPLVDRFKETEPVVVNYSFQLLVVLAKLAKEFIRSRTAKEVLPSILKVLDKLALESYLKDKGSAYRYTQSYKLQLIILENLARIVTDLDMLEQDFNRTMETVFKYISDKQPVPLQKSALLFFETVIKYDPTSTEEKIKFLTESVSTEFEKNVAVIESYVQVTK